ncbi:MAG: Calx-beta domain-containing protein, partial [Actinomycetota bacterium]
IAEPDEVFFLNLRNPVNAAIANGRAKGTIAENDGWADAPPGIWVVDAAMPEEGYPECRTPGVDNPGPVEPAAHGGGGSCHPTFEVVLDRAPKQPVTVHYSTGPGTAETPDDYSVPDGVFTIQPNLGQGSWDEYNDGTFRKRVAVEVNNDDLVEIDETFFVTLSDPVNGVIADGHGVSKILDDDAFDEWEGSTPAIRASSSWITEPDSGSAEMKMIVSLTHPAENTIRVDYRTADDTARAGQDYLSVTGTLTFAAGVQQVEAPVTVLGDTVEEPAESFKLLLYNPIGAEIKDDEGTGTIDDNDGANPGRSSGGAFISMHFPEEAQYWGGAQASGSLSLIRKAVDYVTHANPAPRLLYVSKNAGAEPIRAADRTRFSSIDVADASSAELKDLRTVDFSKYDAVIVGCQGDYRPNDPSGPFGGKCQTAKEDLNILVERRGDIKRYLEAGGGWVGWAQNNAGTFHEFPGIHSTGANGPEAGEQHTITPAGRAIGLVPSDVDATGGITFERWADWDVLETMSYSNTSYQTGGAPVTNHYNGPATLGRQEPILEPEGIFLEDAEVIEGNTGTNPPTAARLKAILPAPAKVPIRVDYRAIAGTAQEGKDFVATAGTLTFNIGETVKSVTVPVVGDSLVEGQG